VRVDAIYVCSWNVAVAACVDVGFVRVHRAVRIGVRVSIAVCVRVSIAVCVRVAVGVRVIVLRLGTFGLVLVRVGVCVRVGVLIAVRVVFVGRDFLGRLAFFRRPADIHRHRLSGLHNLIRTGQLKQHDVGIGVVAWPRRTYAKLQIGRGEYLLGLEPILADNVRHLHFRAAQREINCGDNSEEKNHPNRDYDGDAADY